MLQLPSGQLVGIVCDRARYHAERNGLHISEESPYQALYALVDVVFFVAQDDAPSHKPFVFSGHTLADTAWLSRWPEADRQCFMDWLAQPSQVQEIKRARLRITCRSLPERLLRSDYPERLYSVLQRKLADLSLQRASPEQWRRTLSNMQQAGVRAEELEWSGVLHFLDTAAAIGKSTIAKDELLERIDFSDIRLELHNEMQRRGGCGLNFVAADCTLDDVQVKQCGLQLVEGELAQQRLHEPQRHYRIGTIVADSSGGSRNDTQRWFLLDPDGRAIAATQGQSIPYHASRTLALAAANRHACGVCKAQGEVTWGTTYEYLTLQGGSEYREWVLTLPEYAGTHFGAHYYDRNVLLHIRSKERIDDNGRKLLFIEEIQSDWHQAAHKFGYDNRWHGEIALAPFRNEWVTLALKLLLLHAVRQGFVALAWADGAVQEMRYGKAAEPVTRIYDVEIRRALERLGRQWSAQTLKTVIETRSPWLQAARDKHGWRIKDGQGKLQTQALDSFEEALALIYHHSERVQLAVPLFEIPAGMRAHIEAHGLPLFGERL